MEDILRWMDKHAKVVIGIYLGASLVTGAIVVGIIWHFLSKVW